MGMGVVLLGATVSGTVLGLLLIAPGGQQQNPAATSPTPTPSQTATPTSSGVQVDTGAATVAQAIADAITEGDSLKFGLITCQRQSTSDLKKLQQKWDAAGTVAATVVRPPLVTGDRAIVTIHVDGAGGQKETDFRLQKKGGYWCVPG
jgi:hypothetical protein